MATTRRADMFTADGRPSDDDPRESGPALGDAEPGPVTPEWMRAFRRYAATA